MTDPTDRTIVSESDASGDPEEMYCSACGKSFPTGTLTCPDDNARLIRLAARNDDLINRVLDGRYEIRSPLGRGGMGTVYRAWQLSVDREVAVKVVSPKLASDRNAVKRFLREARLASRLSQPNIVPVYDFGQAENVLYLVMELLRGHTLAAELGQGRRINPKRTITIATQLCDALEAAHAQGIVHRDLKPGNIVILDDPPGRDLIKVLDFGLAKSLVQDSGSAVTNSDALLGTPLYMAPEQIEGKDSDQRVDLYALGCIAYEMLSGRPPFVDSAVSAVLARHLNDAHAPLESHVPPRLRSLVDNLLAKNPDHRVQTAGEVRVVLEQIRDSIAAQASSPIAPLVPADSPDTEPDLHKALAETQAATSVNEPTASVAQAMKLAAPSTPKPAVPTASIAQEMRAVDTSLPPRTIPPTEPKRGSRAVLVVLALLVAVGAVVAYVAVGRNSADKPAAPGAGSADVVEPRTDANGAVMGTASDAAVVDAGAGDASVRDASVRDAATPDARVHKTGGGHRDAGHPGGGSNAGSGDPDIQFHP